MDILSVRNQIKKDGISFKDLPLRVVAEVHMGKLHFSGNLLRNDHEESLVLLIPVQYGLHAAKHRHLHGSLCRHIQASSQIHSG